MEFLHKLTRSRSKDIYFCLPQESLSQGIHTLVNDGDYKEFLDLAYANERRMNVYVDHQNEPIFEWIEEGENEDQDYNCEEDEDSVLSDTYSVDHEEDDAEYLFSTNKTMGDRFLNKLCLHTVNVDDVYEDVQYVEPQYPVHDDRQPWNQMKPLLVCHLCNPKNETLVAHMALEDEEEVQQRQQQKSIKTSENPPSVPTLPAEIIVEILKRLPVESLLRSRSVCKLWCSIISDSHFIKSHLSLSTSNNLYTHHRFIFNTLTTESRKSYLKSCPLYDVLHVGFVNALRP
ncbi:unnamed protein product [Lactuca virosa]|uniref:F-box domain-containing protein n=1 Tax=Lactuca virosa TaxID=75947 RepID=A0AAU9PU39_9ASTR|nr:unnamed protein product [Lactuca virosa]